MNFDLNNTNWTQVENLVEGKTYVLQAKRGELNFDSEKILFAQAQTIPTSVKTGFWNDCFKFQKSELNVYVRTVNPPVNIQIEEV